MSDHCPSKSPSSSDICPPSMTITSDMEDLETSNAASLFLLASCTSSQEADKAFLLCVMSASEFSGSQSPALTLLPVISSWELWVVSLLLSFSAVLLTTKVTTSDPLTSVLLLCFAGRLLLLSFEAAGGNVPTSLSSLLVMLAFTGTSWFAVPVSTAPSTFTIRSSASSSGSAGWEEKLIKNNSPFLTDVSTKHFHHKYHYTSKTTRRKNCCLYLNIFKYN